MHPYWERLFQTEENGHGFVGHNIAAQTFDVDLVIDQEHHSIEVKGVVSCIVLTETCSEVCFLLGRNIENETHASVMISLLQIDRNDVVWTQQEDRFTIPLSQSLSRGETFQLGFHYITIPLARKCWVHSSADGFVPELGDAETELCYEGCWLPVFDNQYTHVYANIQINESLGQQVVFNGKLLETSEIDGVTVYRYTSIMPSYPTVIVGDFICKTLTYENARIMCYYQPGYHRIIDYVLKLAKDIVAMYTEWFGINPVSDISLVQLRRTGFGQYAPSPLVIFPLCDLQPDSAFTLPDASLDLQLQHRLIGMLSHEIGHFWFGGLIHCPSNQRWISEGVATYLTQLAFEQLQSISVIEQYTERIAQIPSHEHAPLADLSMNPHAFLLERGKAALVLHILRQELGDIQFMLLLRTLVKCRQNTIVNTDDIMNLCRKLFPANHMEEFFTTHFYGIQEYTYDVQEQVLKVKE